MVPLFLVDAFAERPFLGQSGGRVFARNRRPDDRWLAAVAAEMKQSETAFLVPSADGL